MGGTEAGARPDWQLRPAARSRGTTMTRRWLTAGAVLAAMVLVLAQPQLAAADMHWLAYYPGAVIDWYDGPYPFLWNWQNIHWPSRNSFFTYGLGSGTYKVYYPTYDASGKYYYLTPKAGVPVEDTTALLEVRVPVSDADIWFQGERTSATGAVRLFRTPVLVPGRSYSYELMALWGDGGRDVKEVRRVPIKAGDRVTVDFRVPAAPEK
jgi:uncharacterized protein (TIGR03000 family)